MLTPALLFLIVFGLGALAGEGGSWREAGALFTLLFLAGSVLRRPPFLLLLAVAFTAGLWRGASLPTSPPRGPYEEYPASVDAVVTRPPVRWGRIPRWRFTVKWKGGRAEVSSPFPPRLQEGDSVRLLGTFRPVRYPPAREGLEEFRRDRIEGRVGFITLKDRSQIRKTGFSRPFLSALRNSVRRSIRSLFPPPLRGLALALFLGDRRVLSKEEKNEFRRAGTAHLLAISGLHVGLMAFVVYRILLRVLGARPSGHRAALVLSSLCGIFYALLTGFSPSAARSSLALAAVTAVGLSGRRPKPASLLAAVLLLIVAVEPALLWSLSLQLSAAAVFGILRFALPPPPPSLVRRLAPRNRTRKFLRHWIAGPIRISFAAFLGTLPLVLHHFGACHPASTITAVVACPLLAFALGFGGAAVLTAPFFPALAHFLVLPCHLSLEGILSLNSRVAAAPGNTVHAPSGAPPLLFLYVAALILPKRRSTSAFLVLLTASAFWLFPRAILLPEGGVIRISGNGAILLYRSGPSVLLLTSRIPRQDSKSVLRRLGVDEVTAAVDLRGAREFPVPADLILSEPGTVRLRRGLSATVRPARGGRLSVEVADGKARFMFGISRLPVPVPLLIGRISPVQAAAREARWVILTSPVPRRLRGKPSAAVTGAEEIVRFRKEGGEWTIEAR